MWLAVGRHALVRWVFVYVSREHVSGLQVIGDTVCNHGYMVTIVSIGFGTRPHVEAPRSPPLGWSEALL